MQGYQQRVVEEKAELDERITKLFAFIGSGDYVELATDERMRLQRQLSHMMSYRDILGERIAAFTS